MTTVSRVKANRYNYTIALLLCLGSFSYGFNSGIIGAVIGQPSWYSYFGLTFGGSYAASIIDACNGLYYAGGFLGCLTVNLVIDRIGRKLGVIGVTILSLVAAIIQTSSVHIAMFIVGRFLGGIGAGMINCIVPLFISELSPAAQRGRLTGFHGVFTVVAYGTIGWAGLGTYFETNPQIQWRLLLALQLCSPIVLLAMSWYLPESPRWLVSKGREREGLQVLERLHRNSADPRHIGAKEEFVQIQAQLATENSQAANLVQLLWDRRYRRRLLTGFGLQVIDQTTGVLVINNYMILVLATLGVTGWKPLMINGFYNSWAACLNVINAFLMDRFGRIRIITIGIMGGVICLCVVTGLVSKYGVPENTNHGGSIAAIVFMFLFVTCYGSCVDATSYVYCSEIFPMHIRAQGVGFATSGVFLMNTVYLISAAKAFANIGWRFYLIFIIIPACALPIIFWYFPETKGLTLEEVGALFGDDVVVDLSHMSSEAKNTMDQRIENAHLGEGDGQDDHVDAGALVRNLEKVGKSARVSESRDIEN